VPLMISGGHKWESNGVIALAMSPRNRMVFYESENIDNLFRGIGQLVGMPIENIVIESRRRETRRYIHKAFAVNLKDVPELAREGLREGNLSGDSESGRKMMEIAREMNVNINNIGRIYGYGDISLSEGWESGEGFPWRTQIIGPPYSLPLYAADMLGSVEAIEEDDLRVEYEEIGDGICKVDAYPGSHPIELKERLRRRTYDFKSGDISFERCPGCGLPFEVDRCTWGLDAGTITDPETGRRMAIFGPSSLEAVLDDLETELGEAIPEAVIRSQRDYVKGFVGEDNWKQDAISFRRLIASRGLGNLTGFEGNRTSLKVTIENSCLHLLMAGTAQAMVEMVYGRESSVCEWSLAGDGDLNIIVTM
jgi:hypothetical protein